MNIGVDIRVLTEERLTGVGYYTLHALQNLLKVDQSNTYYLYSSGLRDYSRYTESLKAANTFFVHIPMANRFLNFLHISRLAKSFFQSFPSQPDIFWLPNANFYKFDKQVPTILTIHDLSFIQRSHFFSRKHLVWHHLVNIKNMLDNSAAILAVSENTRREVVRLLSVEPSKVHTVQPGIEKIELSHTEQLAERFNLKENYVLFVGTLEPRKNISAVINAFDKVHRELPDHQLVLVGNLGWSYRALMKEIGKRDYVSYLGYVTAKEKYALLKRCRVFVWPSFYEGYGFPPLEATSLKVPCIVSHMTSLPEVMKQQAVYVDPYNISDLEKAMLNILKDQNLSQALKKSAENFELPNWLTFAEKLLNIFQVVYEKNSHRS